MDIHPKVKPKTIVLVDIESLCESDDAALKAYSDKFCKKNESPLKAPPTEYPLRANFSTTNSRKIEQIYEEPGFWTSLPTTPAAVPSLQAMEADDQFDVWIVISLTAGDAKSVFEQQQWILDKMGSYWANKVIVCRDKTMLHGDILIDPCPNPETDNLFLFTSRRQSVNLPTLNQSPSWKHVIYDRPANEKIEGKKRLTAWKSWKEMFSISESQYPFFIHGSADSLDEDRYYLFPTMPDSRGCRQFLSGVEEDRNIFVMREGYVRQCYKGYPDEVHNSILATYSLHPQQHPMPVHSPMHRVVALKVAGMVIGMLVRLSQTDYRTDVKAALRSGNFGFRSRCLQEIDFTKLTALRVDDYKFFAFQFAQSIALIQGKEEWTKRGAADRYPDLEPFLYRKEQIIQQNLEVLNQYKALFFSLIKNIKWIQKDNLILCHFPSAEQHEGPVNHLENQCRGLVMEIHDCLLVGYPLSWNKYNGPAPSWPMDNPDLTPNEANSFRLTPFYCLFGFRDVHYLASETTFEPVTLSFTQSYNLSSLDFSNFDFILQQKDGCFYLVCCRNKNSLQLQYQDVTSFAQVAGFKYFPL